MILFKRAGAYGICGKEGRAGPTFFWADGPSHSPLFCVIDLIPLEKGLNISYFHLPRQWFPGTSNCNSRGEDALFPIYAEGDERHRQ